MDGMRESPRLVRFLMDPAFAPFLEFEGFDEVGDIYGGSIDASFAQSAIEKLACRTNKGKTLKSSRMRKLLLAAVRRIARAPVVLGADNGHGSVGFLIRRCLCLNGWRGSYQLGDQERIQIRGGEHARCPGSLICLGGAGDPRAPLGFS